MNTRIVNNTVALVGEVVSDFTFNHEAFGEGFYMIDLAVKRLSDQVDTIPVMVSDRLLDVSRNYNGRTIQVNGQYRSFNKSESGRNRLALYVFAGEILFLRSDLVDARNSNSVALKGFVCKAPVFRETPLGREIADLLIAVNRPYNKSDYIPCIVWGRNARYAADCVVSDAVEIAGRIQSREYLKRLKDETLESRIAYEVSVSKIELILE